MIRPLFVTSVAKNSEKIEHVVIVIRLASLEMLLMKSATKNTRFQSFSQLYFIIRLAMIVTSLLKHLGNSEGDISCIPNNEGNYISFTKQVIVDKLFNKEGNEINVKCELRFSDSLRVMAASLDKLSSNLKIDLFVNLNKYYSGSQLRLLLRKGVYPYDYVDSMK